MVPYFSLLGLPFYLEGPYAVWVTQKNLNLCVLLVFFIELGNTFPHACVYNIFKVSNLSFNF